MLVNFYLTEESATSFPNYSEILKNSSGKKPKENYPSGPNSDTKPIKLSVKPQLPGNPLSPVQINPLLSEPSSARNFAERPGEKQETRSFTANTQQKSNISNPSHPHTTKNASLSNLKEPISILSLLGSQNYVPLDINNVNTTFEKYDTPKVASKSMTEIRSYAANTNQGIVR